MRDIRRDVMSFIRALIRMWQVFIPNKKKENHDVDIQSNFTKSARYFISSTSSWQVKCN